MTLAAAQNEGDVLMKGETSGVVVSVEAVLWKTRGECGISSSAIFNRIVLETAPDEGPRDWYWCNPWDPADFNLCEKLLRQVPGVRERLHEMDAVSSVWAALVERWDEIVSVFEEEAPGVFEDHAGHWRAPKTYDLMKSIIEAGRKG